MSGSRFVVPMPEATCRVEIFDFNGKMLKRRERDATMNGNQETRDRCAEIVGHENHGSDEQEPGHKDLMTIFEVKQTVTDLLPHSYSGRLARKQHAFEEEFEVHLPFMHTAIHLDREASDVMISEEHLVIRHAVSTIATSIFLSHAQSMRPSVSPEHQEKGITPSFHFNFSGS